MPQRRDRKARSPRDAQARYVEFLQRSLSCLDPSAVWRTGAPPAPAGAAFPDEARGLLIANAPLRLRRVEAEPLFLTAGQIFEVVPDQQVQREWRTHTLGYAYTISPDELAASEIFTWHFHPHRSEPDTHLHIGGRHPMVGDLSNLHAPTGRVSFESIVRFLIDDLGVSPGREDWRDLLADAEERFRAWRTWS